MAKINTNSVPAMKIVPPGPPKPTEQQILRHMLMQALQKAIAHMQAVQAESAKKMKESIEGQ